MTRRYIGTVGSLAVAAAALALTASCGDAPSTGAGAMGPASTLERNQALHIPMRDGVRIAVDVWLPEGIDPGARLPTMIRATRYWRARGFVDAPTEGDSNFDEAERWNGAGYALVLIDARGSGASFGIRRFELAEDEVRDYGEVADWIVAQPWSNGRVGAYGVSYAGNTAEMLAVNRNPAVKAVAPLFNDFDNFGHLVFPGGVLTVGFLESWSNRTRMQDLNDICGLSGVTGAECDELRRNQVTGVKPVDADADGALIAAAVAEHEANTVPFGAALEYEFRDDPFGRYDETNVGHRRSPSGHLPQIEESGAAMFIEAGWQDAGTVNGTLGRYNTISNSQQVFIGPWDHGARNDADPFNADDAPRSARRGDPVRHPGRVLRRTPEGERVRPDADGDQLLHDGRGPLDTYRNVASRRLRGGNLVLRHRRDADARGPIRVRRRGHLHRRLHGNHGHPQPLVHQRRRRRRRVR